MIIDSHAHYSLKQFNGEFEYLYDRDGSWAISRADREALFAEMKKCGVAGAIEPSVEFARIEKQLALAAEQKPYIWSAVGVHPTRCVKLDPELRKKVKAIAESADIIAIGETGLDYHYPDEQCSRAVQKEWFIYLLELADSLSLPLILHIRDADEDAIGILESYRDRLHGGVVHCFKSDSKVAERYIALGYAIGVGGKIFSDGEEGVALRDAVKNVPLTSILVETDSPMVAPDVERSLWAKNEDDRPKFRNTSLILPAVIRKIAELKGISAEAVEETVYQNTIQVFDLKI